MRREILMPTVTPSMKDGKISRWHVAEGQAVAAGDLLVEVATSTATFEIEAENEGRVERILVPAGTEGVKVNTPIAILFGGGEARTHTAALAQPLGFASLEPTMRRDPPPRPQRRSTAARVEDQGPSYREALRDALAAQMRADPDVFLIGVDVAQNRGAPRVAQGLLDEFGPARVVSVPTLDEALFGIAVGAAFAGLKPVVEVPAWGRVMEALAPALASAAQTFYLSNGRLPVPIVIRGPNGFSQGMTGEDARCVAATLAQIPGLKVVQPATASTAGALLGAAIRDPGPVAVLEHEQLYPVREAPTEAGIGGLGVARLARTGTDVTIAAAGHALTVALEAANALSRNGIEAEVVDLMCLRPLDRETVAASVAHTGRLVTVEDGWGDLGIGAEIVASVVARGLQGLRSAPLRIAGTPVPMPYAAELQALALPTDEQVTRAVSAMVRGA
ncbi:transketolase C-terminal domain-containing protein [Hyphomicrobium sp.]|uniref:transketolase C-terminal domain-containing protein n=1 Tax=Hyphomicrobium sp. TaxID=82 RepID=UPI0025BF99F8|nr:transketolase C-terminal domain-containing protein [Hyphomicrobium sp.]MCC7250883.1 biotin/lipoyl-binding protein [Hyphomicrobium sp.]